MVITSSVKCSGCSVCCVTGVCCIYTLVFAHFGQCVCVCVFILQHGLESQFQWGNRSRWCQTGAQRELWCLNGGSVLPVSLVTWSVGTQRGLPVSAWAGCCITAVQKQEKKPRNSSFIRYFLFEFKVLCHCLGWASFEPWSSFKTL